MDYEQIKNALAFLNWEMLGAVGLITMAVVQFFKEHLPQSWVIGKTNIPVTKLFTLGCGLVTSHFIFDIAAVEHTETVALFHGFVGAIFSTLGYEILKGTPLSMRSVSQIKYGEGGTK
jgi:hypothetical protein